MLTGVTAGHGPFAVKAVNTTVEICGMEVSPGEIIHMDENGAVKFPAEKLNEVYEQCIIINREESLKQKLFMENNDPEIMDQIRRGVFSGYVKAIFKIYTEMHLRS